LRGRALLREMPYQGIFATMYNSSVFWPNTTTLWILRGGDAKVSVLLVGHFRSCELWYSLLHFGCHSISFSNLNQIWCSKKKWSLFPYCITLLFSATQCKHCVALNIIVSGIAVQPIAFWVSFDLIFTVQHSATLCNTAKWSTHELASSKWPYNNTGLRIQGAHTLQHTLQHTATHCNIAKRSTHELASFQMTLRWYRPTIADLMVWLRLVGSLNYRSLLQKSPIKETILCKRNL